MKRIVLLSCVLIALIGGFAAGFRTALTREHGRLEHNKQILRRVHKEVWSNPDLNAAMKATDELYAPDFVLHDWTGDSHGVSEVKKSVTENRAVFPDSNEEVLDVVAEGSMVMTRFLTTGTQKGDLAAIPGYQPIVPANGKFQRFPELAVHRLVNGKVAEQWDFADMWGANIQADLIDPSNWPASAICRSEGTRTKPSR
jgi:predicted ester cyclase